MEINKCLLLTVIVRALIVSSIIFGWLLAYVWNMSGLLLSVTELRRFFSDGGARRLVVKELSSVFFDCSMLIY
jgi:hypothetical protein